MLVELRGLDRDEQQTVDSFLHRCCGCSIVSGGCCQQFAPAHYEQMRSWCAALSRAELDLILMGQIMSLTNNSELTVNFMSHRHKRQECVHTNMTYFHQGHKVCRATFLFLQTWSRDKNVQGPADALQGEWLCTTSAWKHKAPPCKCTYFCGCAAGGCLCAKLCRRPCHLAPWSHPWVQTYRPPASAILNHEALGVEAVHSCYCR